MLKIAPTLLSSDIQIIRQLGLANSGSTFTFEARETRADYMRKNDFGLARRWLRLRLSQEKIIRGTKNIWSNGASKASSS